MTSAIESEKKSSVNVGPFAGFLCTEPLSDPTNEDVSSFQIADRKTLYVRCRRAWRIDVTEIGSSEFLTRLPKKEVM